eukprot:gene10049-23815_t
MRLDALWARDTRAGGGTGACGSSPHAAQRERAGECALRRRAGRGAPGVAAAAAEGRAADEAQRVLGEQRQLLSKEAHRAGRPAAPDAPRARAPTPPPGVAPHREHTG